MTDVYSYAGAETRLRREASYGVAGSGDFVRLNGLGVRMKPTVTKNRFRPPGAMVPTVGTLDDDYSTGSVEGIVDFNGLLFALAGRFGLPVSSSLGGSPVAYQHLWSWDGRRPIRPVSYECYYGTRDVAEKVLGLIFNSLGISGGRADGFDVSGDAFGKAMTTGQAMGGVTNEVQSITINGTVSGGTFTITVTEIGETTAAIDYDATASEIQTALDALSGLEPGDIVVTGGPIPSAPAVLTYNGPVFAGKGVAEITVNSGSLTGGGTYDPSTTTPGADDVVDIDPVPAGASIANVYLDSTWAGLGGTQLLHAYTMDLTIPEGTMRVRPMNKSQSSDSTIAASEQDFELALTLGINAVERARLAALRASTKEFVRVEWEGDEISGGNDYLLQVDACVDWDDPGDPEDVDSVLARQWNGAVMIDPTSDNAIAIKLINTIANLNPSN